MLTDEQRRFLEAQFVIRLATADAHGVPHLVPLCFAIEKDNVFIANAADSKRLRNVTENPQVALLADHYTDEWTQLAYVLLFGRAEDLPSDDEHADACTMLHERYPQFHEAGYRIEEGSILAVRIERVVAWGDLTPRG